MLEQPGHVGLSDLLYSNLVAGIRYGIGVIETRWGFATRKNGPNKSKHFLRRANAWRIRAMYHLRQGNTQKAEECKKRVELLQIQNSPAEFFEVAIFY